MTAEEFYSKWCEKEGLLEEPSDMNKFRCIHFAEAYAQEKNEQLKAKITELEEEIKWVKQVAAWSKDDGYKKYIPNCSK